VNLIIRGPDLAQLALVSNRVMTAMRQTPGLVDVDSSLNVGNPELQVRVNRDKASDLGVAVADVARALRIAVSGEEDITKYKEGTSYMKSACGCARPASERGHSRRLMVPSARGGLVRLDNVAELQRGTGPAQIDRYNRQRQVTVAANLIPTKPLERLSAMSGNSGPNRPASGYDYYFTGRARSSPN